MENLYGRQLISLCTMILRDLVVVGGLTMKGIGLTVRKRAFRLVESDKYSTSCGVGLSVYVWRVVGFFVVFFFNMTSVNTLASSSERVFYRYLNEQGVRVINFSIPPQYVKNGYDILNLQGQVISKVERQKTKEELALEIKAQRIKEIERNLLRRYSSSDELEEAKQRRLSEVTAQIRMVEGNIALLTNQLNRERMRAAQKERSGKAVPESIQINIKVFESKRSDARRRVARLKQNYNDVEGMFERDIATFHKIEQRRQRPKRANETKVANYSSGVAPAQSETPM